MGKENSLQPPPGKNPVVTDGSKAGHVNELPTQGGVAPTNSPTQAQIEAARNRLSDWHKLYGTIPDDAIAAALAAAAGVKPSFTQEDIEEAKAICARADQTVNQIQVKATIERCAQVAESYIGYVSAPCPKTLAAAIRALKDEP